MSQTRAPHLPSRRSVMNTLSLFPIGRSRHVEARNRWLRSAFLTNLLAQHGSVIPREAQLRIRCVTTQGPQRFRSAGIVIEENVSLFAFDQGQNINVLIHDGSTTPRIS